MVWHIPISSLHIKKVTKEMQDWGDEDAELA